MSYASASQQHLLQVLEILAEADNPFAGLPLKHIVGDFDGDRSQTFRALKNLESAGWAEQVPGGAWRVTPRIGRIAERVRRALNDLGAAYLSPRS